MTTLFGRSSSVGASTRPSHRGITAPTTLDVEATLHFGPASAEDMVVLGFRDRDDQGGFVLSGSTFTVQKLKEFICPWKSLPIQFLFAEASARAHFFLDKSRSSAPSLFVLPTRRMRGNHSAAARLRFSWKAQPVNLKSHCSDTVSLTEKIIDTEARVTQEEYQEGFLRDLLSEGDSH